MKKPMAPKRKIDANARLLKLRGDMTQAEFGARYFNVSPRTYQRYESSADNELPGAVLVLIELYESKGLKLRK